MRERVSEWFDWQTRDLLVVAAFGIVPGIALLPVLYAGFTLRAALGPLVTVFYAGLFYMPGLLSLYVVRKPGASILNGLFVALVWIPITPFGIAVMVPSFVARLGSEIPFALTQYRQFGTGVLLAGGASAGLLSLGVIYVPSGYLGLAVPIQIAFVVGHGISGAVLSGLVAKVLADRLADTGVLTGYPIVDTQSAASQG